MINILLRIKKSCNWKNEKYSKEKRPRSGRLSRKRRLSGDMNKKRNGYGCNSIEADKKKKKRLIS